MSRFNPQSLVVVGEALAAGFGGISLHRDSQRFSFPALLARQLDIPFRQPLLEPPGLGSAPGFARQPVVLPGLSQATVFDDLPPGDFANLSVPGLTLEGALRLYPRSPLVVRDDAVQTGVNLILGARRMATNRPLLTQIQCAQEMRPTGVIVELGFAEALAGAMVGNAVSLPADVEFGQFYEEMVTALSPASLLLLTVPDPFDTPFFSRLADAASVLCVEEEALREVYEIPATDFLTLPALHEIGYQIFGKSLAPLPKGAVVSQANAQAISDRIDNWNSHIKRIAASSGAEILDLHGLVKRFRTEGAMVARRRLSAQYLGGLYGLNGCYFGNTAHALLANEILSRLGGPALDLPAIMRADPAAGCQPARGRRWSVAALKALPRQPHRPVEACIRAAGAAQSLAPLDPPGFYSPLEKPLKLPAGGRQELPLYSPGSYFGDGIAARHCGDLGSGGCLLFGGLALVDSHLKGSLKFTFAALGPVRARFTLSFDPLPGDDSVLATPVMFQMPFQGCGVYPPSDANLVSSGEIDLTTGMVSKLRVYAQFIAIALRTLVEVNPTFPRQPLCFVSLDIANPLEYGSAFARFEPRPDGLLDFIFYGTRFVPLGEGIRWPLNFVGQDGQNAMVPASGTVLHPHLRLSTRVEEALAVVGGSPEEPGATIAPNSVRELTLHTHNSAFGDGFSLTIPELGGPATGRSHILGRVLLQFGVPSGGTVPVAVSDLAPGGIFSHPLPSPISAGFPVPLPPGPTGFYQMLRFPLRTYSMDEIAILDDPFDISIGALDVRTGCFFSDHLHRGFVEQDVINSLLRIEPRVRQSSFFFRGKAMLASTPSNALMFRFRGDEIVPYPAGFAYPQPDLTSAFYAGPGSTLDPYLWLRAIEDAIPGDYVARGEIHETATIGEEFTCEYQIPADSGRHGMYFHYRNLTQRGEFVLHSIAWLSFSASVAGKVPDKGFDTVSFTGFGLWTKNGVESLEQIAVQICENTEAPYIGIQVASGEVSNVDTKPDEVKSAYP